MTPFALLLLPVAAYSGWWLSKKEKNNADPDDSKSDISLPREYLRGLTFLLNEQQDKAVDVFIKVLEVDSDTVETHLALGGLFRRRGEVDRAIRLHQNLVARPNLDKSQRVQALLELGRDYLSAGVLDRAERLCLEVVNTGEQQAQAFRHLLTIYEREKEWEQSIATAKRLASLTSAAMHTVIAHYYCELAEEALKQNRLDKADVYIKRAVASDKKLVRAQLALAEMEYQFGRYKLAIKSFKRAIDLSPSFLSQAMHRLPACYEALNAQPELVTYLEKCLTKNSKISVVLLLADYVKHLQGHEEAVQLISKYLAKQPSIRGLQKLVELQLEDSSDTTRENLLILKSLVESLMQHKPIYRCQHCGFSGRSMHWQCPTCRHWGVVVPIQGVEGD